ncbi:ATP-binding cassette domain-containing protein [Mesorhizobium sp. CA13]|uniref:taurine ABC transporter ATP-binding protein n=1 Tax=unclassified Mesorhizobium TaxID=325217 RepID=UPI001CCDB29D|nr:MULTISPECIES: taurine ABC transporter ATP-binding protein [unclassified Mesorhizobium]MBZ9855706.1 ATP-binding cassette domain-containing protein [Mesorhizobium sp. CA13]MBZ9963803.1 ATP-binding cassette domain-containing protein [Mesorhizobium sp. BR1-1-2]
MSHLVLDRISVHYDGQPAPAVERVSIDIAKNDFVILVGRSGCGKTSLLNVAAGFVTPARGTATINGRPIAAPGSDRAVVFQNDALFPWLTARENVAFALRLRGVGPSERARRADELLGLVKLTDAGDKRIWELSGGMRQRVGLARALAAEPQFLLLDEPLGALDALTRERMQTTLLDLWTASKVGVLMVTHGTDEALVLATRIVVLAPGPGRVVRTLEPGFSRRYASGEAIRAIKADPGFAAARGELTDAIFEGEAA